MNNKEKIQQSALFLFAKNGYTETSIEKIARHAKVSKGLTYNHFKNKDELLRVTIENTITRMTSEMMEIDELNLKSFFTGFFTSLQQNAAIVRLCILLVAHPQTPSKVNALLENQKQDLLQLLSALLTEQFKDNAKLEALILLATINGITLEYATNPSPSYLKEMQSFIIKKYTK